MRAAKEHSTASAWNVTVKDSKRYRADEHELFKGKDGSVIYADVYRVSLSCSEELLTPEALRHGFKSAAHVASFETSRLPINEHRAKRHEMKMKINAMRSRSRKKKYADNPVPVLRQTASREERVSFFAQLQDFSVLLSDLSQNVPFGFKGESLLEMLWNKRIPIIRATWFIKVVYLNIYGDKSKHMRGRNPRASNERKMKCRDEWTEQVKLYLTKQLSNILSSMSGTEFRPRAESVNKWQYLRQLLSWQYEEGLLARVKLLHWLLLQLDHCATNSKLLVGALFWLPIVSQFLNDIQQSRLHVRKLYHISHRLREKTIAGRVSNHEAKTRICDCAEGVIRFLEKSVPLCVAWGSSLGGNATMPEAVLQPPAQQPTRRQEFNLPNFLLMLDSIKHCLPSPTRTHILSACIPDTQEIEGAAVLTIVEWCVSVLRSHLPVSLSIALSLLEQLWQSSSGASAQQQQRRAISQLLLDFLFDYKPTCSYEFRQIFFLYARLCSSGMFQYDKYIRRLVCYGLLEDAAEPSGSEAFSSVHQRYLSNVLPSDASAVLKAQRKHCLYGFASKYDERLERLLQCSLLQHFNALSGGLFAKALAAVDDTLSHHLTSDAVWSHRDKEQFSELYSFVDMSDASLTDAVGLVRCAPYLHVLPLVNTCDKTLRLLLSAPISSCHSQLFERVLVTLLSVLDELRLHHDICSLTLFLLPLRVLQSTALYFIRRYHALFVGLNQLDKLRSTLADVMRREFDSLQSAEIWLNNARLHHNDIFLALSEQLAQTFAGSYRQQAIESRTVEAGIVRDKLERLLLLAKKKMHQLDEELFECVQAALQEIAVDNTSIGLIYSLIMHSILSVLSIDSDSDSDSVECELVVLRRHVFLLRELNSASDRLGDNRAPCAALALSHFLEKLVESSLHENFAASVLLLVNSSIIHLKSLLDTGVLRPLRTALEVLRRKSQLSAQQRMSALAASLLLQTLFCSNDNDDANANDPHQNQTPFSKSLAIERRQLAASLAAESVDSVFSVVSVLAELSLQSCVPLVSAAAQKALDTLLDSTEFARFCLREPDEIHRQLSTASSSSPGLLKLSRQIYTRLCQRAQGVDSCAVLASDGCESGVLPLLRSISAWTLARDCVSLKLLLAAIKQQRQHTDIEANVAQLLLATNQSRFEAQLAVETMKKLGSSVGRHILSGVKGALEKEEKVVWRRFAAMLNEYQSLGQVFGTMQRQYAHALLQDGADVAVASEGVDVSEGPQWLESVSVVVAALAESLPTGDCLPLVTTLCKQLERVAEPLRQPGPAAHALTNSPVVATMLQEHVLRRIRCLHALCRVIHAETAASVLQELVKALLVLLGSQMMQVTYTNGAPSSPFSEALGLFESLIDQMRFGSDSSSAGGNVNSSTATQRKEEDFIVQLDRELSKMQMPVCFRRMVQRTLPTFSGAICESNRLQHAFTSLPAPSSELASSLASMSPGLMLSQTPTNLGASPCSQPAPPSKRRRVSKTELQCMDAWTVLQGVAGTPLVQRLLEYSSIVSRDGSSVGHAAPV